MRAKAASHGPLLVVTDLMGTTLRDDGAVLPAYHAAFAECSIPYTEEELAARRGAHKLSLFTEFALRRYPADEAPKVAAAALEVFEKQLRHYLATGGGSGRWTYSWSTRPAVIGAPLRFFGSPRKVTRLVAPPRLTAMT